MPTLTKPDRQPLSPEDTRLAKTSGATLKNLMETNAQLLVHTTLRLTIEQENGEVTELKVPAAALSHLSKILRELGNGKDLVTIASDVEVTTQQAANYLNVSRPYFVKLLEEGNIPYRLVGPRRRLLLSDLVSYKLHKEAELHRGLDELSALSQELGLY